MSWPEIAHRVTLDTPPCVLVPPEKCGDIATAESVLRFALEIEKMGFIAVYSPTNDASLNRAFSKRLTSSKTGTAPNACLRGSKPLIVFRSKCLFGVLSEFTKVYCAS